MANGHSSGDDGSVDESSVNVSATRATRTSTTAVARATASRDSPRSSSAGPDDVIQAGQGVFAKPPPMTVGSWSRLEFLVAPDAAGIAAEAGGRETSAADAIFISPVMRVTLLPDPNFDVSPQTPAEQRIGLDKRASWHWNVKPKERGGTFTLVARVQVLDDGEVVDDYTSRVDVRVTVGRRERIAEEIGFLTKLADQLAGLFGSWQKALAALAALITAGFVVWRTIKNRGASSGKPG